MASRLIDTLFFQAEGILGKVYYNDGAGSGNGRSIDVAYYKASDNSPSPPPASQYSQFTGQRGGQPGQPLLNAFCEGLDAVTVNPSTSFPFATISVQAGASICAAPVVVCDLAVTGSVSGTTVTIAVTTSHGPWSSSVDGVNFSAGRTVFALGYGNRGTITVKDAANCQQTCDYVIADPANPKPAGELLDVFSYGAADPTASRVEVYGLRNAPYTVAAWSPAGVALPGALTAEQRGRPAGYELPARCGGATNTTRIQSFVTLEPPYVRLVTTDNSSACGYVPYEPPTGNFRFDYVLGTDESAAGGDGLIQAAVLGNDGPVVFSLDNFLTSQVSGTFQGLRAGTYTVYARETRPQGRTISRQLTLTEPAHGLRYRVPLRTRTGVAAVVNLYLRGYQGEAETLLSAQDGTSVEWAAGNASAHFFEQLICGSEGTVTVVAQVGNDLADLDLSDERQLRFELVVAGTLAWVGWVLPDLYEAPHLARPYPVTVRATDGLGALQDVPLADGLGNPLTGTYSHWQLLRYLVGRLALPLPWAVLHTLYPDGVAADAATEPLALVACDAAGFTESDGKPWTCAKVLQSLLDYHELRLMQRAGCWYFERLAELATDLLTPRRYDAQGQALASPAPYLLLRVVELPPVLPSQAAPARYWAQARQLLSRHPAVAGVQVQAEPGAVRNYFPGGDFPASAFDPTSGLLLAWSGAAVSARQPDASDTSKPASLLLKQANALAAPYVDSPEFTVPVGGLALVDANGGPAGYQPFQCWLSFTVKLVDVSFTPDPPAGAAAFYVSLGVRDVASGQTTPLFLNRADLAAGQLAPVKVPVYELTGTGEAKVRIPFAAAYFTFAGSSLQNAITVRFYAPTVGDVLVSDVQVTVGTATNGSYVNQSAGDTLAGPRLSKRDTGLTLQLADTLNPDERVFAVLARSVLLTATGGPVALWREGLSALAAYYLIDLLVRDRLGWQQRPCWVLRGVLRGDYAPGALLVDPAFDPAAAFVTSATSWNITAETWDLTAVQALGYHAALPVATYGLLAEDGTLLLSEDSAYTLEPEDAY